MTSVVDVNDDLSLSSTSLGTTAASVSVSNIAAETVTLTYSVPSADVPIYYTLENSARRVASVLGGWPSNLSEFKVFDAALTSVDVSVTQGSEYVVLYGGAADQLARAQFRTCPGGCEDGACTPDGLCTSCRADLFLNGGFCCHFSCRACRGPTANDCLTCNESYKKVDEDGSCQCALGQYTGADNQCHKCFDDCTRCNSPD